MRTQNEKFHSLNFWWQKSLSYLKLFQLVREIYESGKSDFSDAQEKKFEVWELSTV